MNVYCSVSNCLTSSLTHPHLWFHPFPKENTSYLYVTYDSDIEVKMDRKQIWETVLLMKTPALPCQRVCSLHFQRSDYYCPEKKITVSELHPTAIPTLKLPQKATVFRICAIEACRQQSNIHRNVQYFTLNRLNTSERRWRLWTKIVKGFDEKDEITVCSDHFRTGAPVDDPACPDYSPNKNMTSVKEVKEIEEVDVYNYVTNVGDTTAEDPLKLAEPEFVQIDDINIKQELPEEIFEDNIKVEPVDFDEVDVKMEVVETVDDHCYCR